MSPEAGTQKQVCSLKGLLKSYSLKQSVWNFSVKYWRSIEVQFSSLMAVLLWKGERTPSLRWKGRECTVTRLNLEPLNSWGAAGLCPYPTLFMIYLVTGWCEIRLNNCCQRNQITVSSSKGGSSTSWCKRVMSVHPHLLPLLLLKLTENGECLGYTQSYPWRCVFFCTSALGYTHELKVLSVLFIL